MIVDTSALIAILFDEPEKSAFANMIDTAADPKVSAVTRVEAMMVYLGRRRNEPSDVLDLIEILGLKTVDVDRAHGSNACVVSSRSKPQRHRDSEEERWADRG